MRILVIKLSSLGDLFHALPAVHCLKKGLNAAVDWVTNDSYVDLVRCFDDVDRVIPFYRKAFFSSMGSFLPELRKDSYDSIVDMQGLFKSSLTAFLARGGKRVGPSFNRECSRLFYNAVAGTRDKGRHAVDENMDFADFFKVERLEPAFPVTFPDLGDKVPDGRNVAVAPLSRWETKNWPMAHYVELVSHLINDRGCNVYLVGGPGDVSVCGEIEKAVDGNVVNCAGKYSLPETGALLGRMSLLISNDSGPIHMASAAGTPVLSLFGPTDPARTGPYGPDHRTVQKDLPCRPCFSRSCGLGTIQCLTDISPEEVLETAVEMLN